MWKKLLTPTLLFTLVLLFALTWFVSIKAEEHFSLWVKRSNQVAPIITSTDLVSYNRGFFTAEAVTSIDIKDIGRYDFHHLIRHYLWGINVTTTPQTMAESPSFLAGLRIITDVGPTGAARSRLSMPQLKIASDLGPSVTIDRIAAEGRVNAAATEGSWDMTLDQLKLIVDEYNSVLLTGLQSSGEMTNLDYFPLGRNRTRVAAISFEDGRDNPLLLEGIEIHGNNLIDSSDIYLARSELAFARLLASGHEFQNGRLILELRDIDARVIDVLVEAGHSLRNQTSTTMISDDEIASLFIEPLSRALLRSGLTLSLEELSLTADDANLHGQGLATLAANQADVNLEQLAEQIRFTLGTDFDIQILARINQLFSGKNGNLAQREEELRIVLGTMTQLGFLSRVGGDRFRLLVSYEDGEFELNGQAFRLF